MEKIHCIGKNVWKFHAIYWPALLLSANLPLPNQIYVHRFLTESGQKISKSLGAKVDPLDLVELYGSDSVRFYLLHGFSPYTDGDFSIEGLIKCHNTFLVNGLGNLFSRLWKLCESAGITVEQPREREIGDPDNSLFKFNDLSHYILRVVDRLNSEVNSNKAWEKIKEGQGAACEEDLRQWTSKLIEIGYLVEPILTEAGGKIQGFTQTKENIHLYSRLKE